MMRLSQVARKLNIGKNTIIEFLKEKGFDVEDNPNYKINDEQLGILSREFADSALDKEEASSLSIGTKHSGNVVIDASKELKHRQEEDEEEFFIKSHHIEKSAPEAPVEEEKEPEEEKPEEIATEKPKLKGIKVLGKIDLDSKKKIKTEEKEAEKAPEKAKDEAELKAEEEKKEAQKEDKTPVREVEEEKAVEPSQEAEVAETGAAEEKIEEVSDEKAIQEQYEKETGKNAIWRGKVTKGYLEWKAERFG